MRPSISFIKQLISSFLRALLNRKEGFIYGNRQEQGDTTVSVSNRRKKHGSGNIQVQESTHQAEVAHHVQRSAAIFGLTQTLAG